MAAHCFIWEQLKCFEGELDFLIFHKSEVLLIFIVQKLFLKKKWDAKFISKCRIDGEFLLFEVLFMLHCYLNY